MSFMDLILENVDGDSADHEKLGVVKVGPVRFGESSIKGQSTNAWITNAWRTIQQLLTCWHRKGQILGTQTHL